MSGANRYIWKIPVLIHVADLELRRLEQRYIQRKKRNTWTSDAVYVDGEYKYSSKPPGDIAEVTSPSGSSSSRPTDDSGISWTSKGAVARIKEMQRKSTAWLKR